MAKKDMKKALGASLKAEEQAVRSRFEKAESLLGKGSKATRSEARQAAANNSHVIRDSFTIPASEYELISRIKKRCMKEGVSANKSEILRAGLAVLAAMSDAALRGAVEGLKRVKTGRPPTKKT